MATNSLIHLSYCKTPKKSCTRFAIGGTQHRCATFLVKEGSRSRDFNYLLSVSSVGGGCAVWKQGLCCRVTGVNYVYRWM